MKILRLLVAVCLLSVSGIAAADPQSYTNIEAFFGRQSALSLTGGTAYRLAGSYDLSDTFYTYGQYSNNTFGDFSGSSSGLDSKQSQYMIGLGMHEPIADSTDWIGRFAIAHDKGTSSFSTSAHTGYDLGMGVNTALTTGVELSTFLDHTTAGIDTTSNLPSISASAGETILSGSVHVQMGKNFDLGFTEEFSSLGSENRFLISGRWDF